MLSLSVASCNKIDNPSFETPNEPEKPSTEEPEASVRDGVEIIITKSADDSDLPLLCSNGRNEVTAEFTISPAVKGFRYELVCDADVRSYVDFNADGTSGTISIISNGDMGREPFNVGLTMTEAGENVNPLWSEYAQWTISPAYLEIRPVKTDLPAKNAVVEFVVESNLDLDIDLTYSYYLLRDSIVWEDGKCSFRLRDNDSYYPINCDVKVFNEEYKMKSFFGIHQQGKDMPQPDDDQNGSGNNVGSGDGNGSDGEGSVDITVSVGDMVEGGESEIQF